MIPRDFQKGPKKLVQNTSIVVSMSIPKASKFDTNNGRKKRRCLQFTSVAMDFKLGSKIRSALRIDSLLQNILRVVNCFKFVPTVFQVGSTSVPKPSKFRSKNVTLVTTEEADNRFGS